MNFEKRFTKSDLDKVSSTVTFDETRSLEESDPDGASYRRTEKFKVLAQFGPKIFNLETYLRRQKKNSIQNVQKIHRKKSKFQINVFTVFLTFYHRKRINFC